MSWFKKGYIGSKMSERAAEAYDDGLKPLSKWTKEEIINCLEDYFDGEYDFSKIKKEVLIDYFLTKKEWHHTGSFYQETSFYGLDEDSVSSFSKDKYDELIIESKAKKEQDAHKEIRYVKVKYVEWSGSRNHPKSTDVYDFGKIEGDWFYGSKASRKKVSGNWFDIIKKYDSEKDLLLENDYEAQHQRKLIEEAEQKAEETRQKKETEEYKKRLYCAYAVVHPDITKQKFARNESMKEEAKTILNNHTTIYKNELETLMNKRQNHELTKIEFQTAKTELNTKYHYVNKD